VNQFTTMERLARNRYFFQALKRSRTDRDLKAVIKQSNPDSMKALCDVCSSVCSGKLKLKKREKVCLKPYAKIITVLGKRNKPSLTAKKRMLIKQKGSGFLIPLASIAASLLPMLLGK
jgi:hypothetical protein